MLRIESAFAGRQNLTWLVIAGWAYWKEAMVFSRFNAYCIGMHILEATGRINKQRHVRSEKAHAKKGMHIIVGFMQNRNNAESPHHRHALLFLDSSRSITFVGFFGP